MKKMLLSMGALFALSSIDAQTTLLFEDFEGGAGNFAINTADEGGQVGSAGGNEWIINNVYTGGTGVTTTCVAGSSFTIGDTDAQPAGISNANGNYLHMISREALDNVTPGPILNASYSPADGVLCITTAESHFVSMTSDVNTTSMTNVTMSFWWLNLASTSAVGEVYYSVDGGTTWTQKTGTSYEGQSTWLQETLTDVAWDGQSTLRFGFRFNNGVVLAGSDPALSIDDVLITGDDFSGLSQNNKVDFEIYPNPTTDLFSIELNSTKARVDMVITDINGKVIFVESYSNVSSINNLAIEVETGIYIITISDSDGNVSRMKIVKE